ncbi:MAG: phosphoribosylanthranilate isomerase [Bacillota bacterium]|nr:phosphoribosylanthranilate isomerase [Bacillota bacterium]
MDTLVKICGIRDVASAEAAVSFGADYLGFVFAESKRRINIEKAKEIIKYIPSNVAKVGVFVNESIETLEYTALECGLDYVQLHGKESSEFCKKLKVPVIKSFSIKEKKDINNITEYEVKAYLVDSDTGKYAGGSGVTFNWELLNNIDESIKKKLILAGGLNADNVLEAIEKIKPFAVDVSSGVETEGRKDLAKIEKFIKIIKNKNKTF